jgi:hypothetical protein
VDHKTPVIDPVLGFVDWNTFVNRVFCGPENLQRICSCCHDKKTAAENLARWVKTWEAELSALDLTDKKAAKKVLRRLSKKPQVGPRALALLQGLSGQTALAI